MEMPPPVDDELLIFLFFIGFQFLHSAAERIRDTSMFNEVDEREHHKLFLGTGLYKLHHRRECVCKCLYIRLFLTPPIFEKLAMKEPSFLAAKAMSSMRTFSLLLSITVFD